jgi:hypothetical protein
LMCLDISAEVSWSRRCWLWSVVDVPVEWDQLAPGRPSRTWSPRLESSSRNGRDPFGHQHFCWLCAAAQVRLKNCSFEDLWSSFTFFIKFDQLKLELWRSQLHPSFTAICPVCPVCPVCPPVPGELLFWPLPGGLHGGAVRFHPRSIWRTLRYVDSQQQLFILDVTGSRILFSGQPEGSNGHTPPFAHFNHS